MVLCFDCSVNTKRLIDELLRTGRYTGLSEMIAVSISNQALLQAHTDQQGAVLFTEESNATGKPQSSEELTTSEAHPVDLASRRVNGVSALFRTRPTRANGPVADLPDDLAGCVGEISPSNWIFGQYNRLLPAKASCRALANLVTDGRGIDVAASAKKIASEVTEFGNYLRMVDRRYQRTRDEMWCTAFPGVFNPDKGRLRYANQFVASADKQGHLSGLLFDYKLINCVSGRGRPISLTDAGWKFALLENPILDSDGDVESADRLTLAERQLLLAHIRSSVPRERSAFELILSTIAQGKNTPESISEVMRTLERSAQENDALLATQRSGAISRMSDLALLTRARDGIRVRYDITEGGERFLLGKTA